MEDYFLEMKNITKSFHGIVALNNINFKVKYGEIHCLVGENGAGKSTLMKILSGVYGSGTYEGEIIYNGSRRHFRNTADSEQQGIAIIYQELALIPELSIYENIFFGHEIMNGRVIDWNKTIEQATNILKKVRLNINPSTKVKYLGVGNQQLVEIAKALSKDVKLLVFDEPTAALNEDDSENLLKLIKSMKDHGITCIMISHKLKEVKAIADTITILRDGMTVGSINADIEAYTESDIIKKMVGREIDNIFPKRKIIDLGDVCFEVSDWTVEDTRTGREILNNININVRKGEIVGIQGLMGAGRTEFALSLFGNQPGYRIKSGKIKMNGKEIKFKRTKEAIEAGIAYVSEDRKKNGLIVIQDIKYNIGLANLKALCKKLTINENEEIKVADEYRHSINIKAASILQQVRQLSGGNQQKVQIAKWIYTSPQILILDEPTRGIDIGAKFEIYNLMNGLVEKGMSIIMISSELPEIMGMSDRLYIMSAGKITGELTADEATEEKIMSMAVGT